MTKAFIPWAIAVFAGACTAPVPTSSGDGTKDSDPGWGTDPWADDDLSDDDLSDDDLSDDDWDDSLDHAFLVSIRLGGASMCSGALIDSTTVVTAAHCITSGRSYLSGSERLNVVPWAEHHELGDISAVPADSASAIDVEAVWLHPDYTGSVEAEGCQDDLWDTGYLDTDVALLRLSRPALGRPISLASAAPSPGESLTHYGYGRAGPSVSARPAGPQTTELVVRSAESVANHGDYSSVLVFELPGPEVTCGGDSGGPIVGTQDGQPVLHGVLKGHFGSNNVLCAIGGYDVATRVDTGSTNARFMASADARLSLGWLSTLSTTACAQTCVQPSDFAYSAYRYANDGTKEPLNELDTAPGDWGGTIVHGQSGGPWLLGGVIHIDVWTAPNPQLADAFRIQWWDEACQAQPVPAGCQLEYLQSSLSQGSWGARMAFDVQNPSGQPFDPARPLVVFLQGQASIMKMRVQAPVAGRNPASTACP